MVVCSRALQHGLFSATKKMNELGILILYVCNNLLCNKYAPHHLYISLFYISNLAIL